MYQYGDKSLPWGVAYNFQREYTNPYDHNTIAVTDGMCTVGHITRADAKLS